MIFTENNKTDLPKTAHKLVLEAHDSRCNITAIKRLIKASILAAEELIKLTPLAGFDPYIQGYEAVDTTLSNNDLSKLRIAAKRIYEERPRAEQIAGGDFTLTEFLEDPVILSLELFKHINQTRDRKAGWLSEQICRLAGDIGMVAPFLIDRYAATAQAESIKTAINNKIEEITN